MPDKSEIIVTCAIVEQEGLVLVTQRSQQMQQPLLWEFPGGKAEDNETETACLVREIKEELQVQVTPLIRLTPVSYDYGLFSIKLVPYICRFEEGTIQLAEHAAYAWEEPRSLKNYDWCPADIPVVEEYLGLFRG